jgi:hypothetical protein
MCTFLGKVPCNTKPELFTSGFKADEYSFRCLISEWQLPFEELGQHKDGMRYDIQFRLHFFSQISEETVPENLLQTLLILPITSLPIVDPDIIKEKAKGIFIKKRLSSNNLFLLLSLYKPDHLFTIRSCW